MIRLADLPSFMETSINFPMPNGQYLTNASVAVRDGQIFAAVCGGDHFMDERGIFIPWPPGTPEDPNRFSRMSVHLVTLNNDLDVIQTRVIETPDAQTPVVIGETYRGFRGFDSARLFVYKGELYCAMCVMGTGAKPEAAFYYSPIDTSLSERALFYDVKCIVPSLPEGFPSSYAEKNWMPHIIDGKLRFHYRLGILADLDGNIEPNAGGFYVMDINGGSQVIPYGDGAMCIMHQFYPVPNTYRRSYMNCLVMLDDGGMPVKICPQFSITGDDPEIITGLALHPDGERLMLSYGRGSDTGIDRYQEKPFIATIDLADLGSLL